MLSQLLTPNDFGTLMLITGTGQFISVLLFEWLRLCTLRYADRGDFHRLRIRELYLLLSFLLIAVTFVLALLQRTDAVQLHVAETLGYALCLGLSDGAAAYLRARGLFAKASAFWLGRSLLGVAAGLVFVMFGADGAATSVGLGISYLVVVIPLIATTNLTRGMAMHDLSGSVRKLLQFGVPMMLSGLMNTGIAALARGFVAVSAGVAAAGAFALIWELAAKALGSAATAVTATSLRRLVVAHDGPNAERAVAYRNYAVAVLATTLPAAAGLAAVGPELVVLLLPPALWAVADAQFAWIVVACFGLTAKTFLVDSVFFAAEQSYTAALASLAGVLITGGAAAVGVIMAIEPVATISAAVTAGCFAVAVIAARRSSAGGRSLPKWLREVSGVLLATAIMSFAVWGLSGSEASYPGLAIRIVVGVATYAAAIGLLDRLLGAEIIAAVVASLRRSTLPPKADLPTT
jgi:hypothetical protein